jgi:hypothetical protein
VVFAMVVIVTMVSMLVATMTIMIQMVFVWLVILRRGRRLMRRQCDGDDAPHLRGIFSIMLGQLRRQFEPERCYDPSALRLDLDCLLERAPWARSLSRSVEIP